MYDKVGNNECSVMQLKLLDSSNASVMITTPNEGRTGQNDIVHIHAFMTLGLLVLNEPFQVLAQVVWTGHHKVRHTWLLNTDLWCQQ